MVSVVLVQRSSAEVSLSSEIYAFIAQHLKVDVASMDAHSHLTEDFGLDLFEITGLLTVLEERFGVDAETADEPNQIEFVGHLIRYIESSAGEEALTQPNRSRVQVHEQSITTEGRLNPIAAPKPMEVIATHIVPSLCSSSPQTHGEDVSSNVDFKASVAPELLSKSQRT
jgi:acyl carrier protein